MNQAAFLEAGDYLHLPTRGGADPVEKGTSVAGVAQGTGGDHADAIGGVGLGGAMKAAQHAQGEGHSLRVEGAAGKHTFTQACDLAVLVQGYQTTAHNL